LTQPPAWHNDRRTIVHPKSTPSRKPTTTSYRPIIRRLSQGVYQIGSRTIPGALYTVTLTGRSSHTCTCPSFVKAGRGCWHHGAARQASAFFAKWYGQASPRLAAPAINETPAAAPTPIPFNQTAGYQRLAECFA